MGFDEARSAMVQHPSSLGARGGGASNGGMMDLMQERPAQYSFFQPGPIAMPHASMHMFRARPHRDSGSQQPTMIPGIEQGLSELLGGSRGGRGSTWMQYDSAMPRRHPNSSLRLPTASSHGAGDGFDEYEALGMLEDVAKRGVSDKKLRSFRVKPVDRRMVTRERCHVCQCEYEAADQIMELPCKHSFHPDCIKGWFKENRTCPTCRTEVEA